MNPLDLVIRNARVATAADVFDADIGIAGGRIVALGQQLSPAAREIDAGGRVVTPGGVDAHCHLCLLYTSPSPRDLSTSRMPSSA